MRRWETTRGKYHRTGRHGSPPLPSSSQTLKPTTSTATLGMIHSCRLHKKTKTLIVLLRLGNFAFDCFALWNRFRVDGVQQHKLRLEPRETEQWRACGKGVHNRNRHHRLARPFHKLRCRTSPLSLWDSLLFLCSRDGWWMDRVFVSEPRDARMGLRGCCCCWRVRHSPAVTRL